MGLPMAKNLLKSSATLNLFDTNPAAFASFPASQIQKCSSPADVSSRSDLIITMLPMGKHVRDVYMGENGILVGLKEGTICIDSSTIDVKTTKDVAESVAKKGGVMVDAPVSGGVNGATAGTLTFMIGASASAFECIKPVLSFMGKNIVYCGPNGHGMRFCIFSPTNSNLHIRSNRKNMQQHAPWNLHARRERNSESWC